MQNQGGKSAFSHFPASADDNLVKHAPKGLQGTPTDAIMYVGLLWLKYPPFIETEEASVMFKRVMAFLIICLMLIPMAVSPALAASPTPTPTPRPTPTPQPTIPVFGTSDVEPPAQMKADFRA